MIEYNEFENIIKKEGTAIVLDTNVILDLARYSLYTSKNILSIFDECNDLIWIPNQVFKEYNKNKNKVFGDLEKRYLNFEKKLLSISKKSKYEFEKVLNLSDKYKYFGIKKFSDDLKNKIEEFENIIKSYKDNISAEYSTITSNPHEIKNDIENFIDSLDRNKQIGEKIGFKEQLDIIKEGELRYKYKLPPGFEDDKKDGIEKFGDLFLWKEILKLPSQKNVVNIIFITNDKKGDWWSKDTAENLEMRSELLDEFKEINPNTSINFMTISMFQKYASEMYELYEFGVYVDLNKNDDLYIERISDKIINDIKIEINNKDYYSLYSQKLCGIKIEDGDIFNCVFKRINDVYSVESDSELSITYELEYEIELSKKLDEYSQYDYIEKYIKSTAIKQIFKGKILVIIERNIRKEDTESKHSYLNEDDLYQDFMIIDDEIECIHANRYGEEYNEYLNCEEIFPKERAFTCPRCGRIFEDFTEDIGGFCSDCAFED